MTDGTLTPEPAPQAGADEVPARLRRSRRVLVLVLVGVVGLGVAVADVGSGQWVGVWADALGSVLYTAAVYLGLAVVRPRAREVPLAAVALGVAVAVELAQLTGAPAALVALWPPVALVLGTTFDARDLLAYLVGAVGTGALDHAVAVVRAHVRASHAQRND